MWLRIACVILLLAACGKQDGVSTPPSSTPTSPPPTGTLPTLQSEFAFPDLTFTSPVFITHAGDGTNRLFVVQQGGQIQVFPNDPAGASTRTFLDIATLPQTRFVSGGELGLLGLAFDPNYSANGFFYVNYTITNPNSNAATFPYRTRVARFKISAGDSDQADPNSETILLEFDQPFANHNGGMIAFGPDGKLYIATGDGGDGNDPMNNAQNLGVLLGKILRIDTDPNNRVPADNPFVSTPSAMGEIWAYGMRNPFRMSFDRATGRLWVGDVGQSTREEVDVIVKGGNYGWRIYEGNRSNINPMNLPLTDFMAPVLDYDRTIGTTVIGGYVYHGPGLPDYAGVYVYGDFGNGRIWALVYDASTKTVLSNTQVATMARFNLSSFGEDEAGELYVVGLSDGKIRRFRQM
ncbi:MAG TPA: PQQ-dependent sugar dehydrogenase [Burkholderiales bacterium]